MRACSALVGLTLTSLGIGACFLTAELGGLSGGVSAGDSGRDDSADAARVDAPGPPDGGVTPADATVAGDASSYREVVLADQPVAYWRLGEASGTTAGDESLRGNDATYVGSCALGRPGVLATDTAAELNGSDSYIEHPGLDFIGRAPFSLEAWIKPTLLDDVDRHVMNKLTTGASQNRNQFGIYLWGPGGGAAEGLGFDRIVSGSSLEVKVPNPPLNVFTYVVGTYDGSALTLYVNGAQAGPSVPDARAIPAKLDPFFVGAKSRAYKVFAGTIDEAAVYDKALSPATVQRHYDVGSGSR